MTNIFTEIILKFSSISTQNEKSDPNDPYNNNI